MEADGEDLRNGICLSVWRAPSGHMLMRTELVRQEMMWCTRDPQRNGIITNADGHRILLAWQGRQGAQGRSGEKHPQDTFQRWWASSFSTLADV